MKGEILIRIEGLMLEKLIQRSLASGAVFKNITRTSKRTMTVEAARRDADILLSMCRRYGISAKIADIRGRSRFRTVLSGRPTLPAGIFAFFAVCFLVLGRIWIIDITFTGPQSGLGDPSPIEAALLDMDIHPGIPDNIDTAYITGRLEASLDGYSYISAKTEGIRLSVEAAEEVPAPEIYDIGYARDLYASIGGIVESVQVHSGIACVSPGDIIKPGQLLIRGEERVTQEENRSIGAKGEVIVRTWYEGASQGSLKVRRTEPTGRTSVSSHLVLMDFAFPIAGGDAFENCEVTATRLPVVGMFLPVEILREERCEVREILADANLETLSEQLTALSMADAAIRLTLHGPDTFDIARSWIRYDNSGKDMLKACAVYEIYTDAAATRGALLQGG